VSISQPLEPDHLQSTGPVTASRASLSALRISAAWLWSGTGEPIPHGALLTDANGRITAVGASDAVPHPKGVRHATYPDAILLPGFVNTHTHLELQPFHDALPEEDFVAWLLHMRRIRETTESETYLTGAREGLIETWRHGTTTVADVGASGATIAAITELGGRGCYYHEVIGPEPDRADDVMAEFVSDFERLAASAPTTLRLGVSPHAPYTVSPALARKVAAWSRQERLPVAVHLAESHAEVSLLARHAGPFADNWRRRGIPMPAGRGTPVQWARDCGMMESDLLGIHLVHATDRDLAWMAASGASVAACVLSNRRHGHGDPPLGAMLEGGLRLGLGTDSAASVGPLDLIAEARAARALAGLSAVRAMQLITTNAAAALGMDQSVGSLEVGKWADCCVARLAEGSVDRSAETVLEWLLEHGGGAIISTYLAGRAVYAQ
jgi:cytosine/adenosine deaminase-related metal-dependent hydrolase